MESALCWIGSDGALRCLEPEPRMDPNKDYIWWDEYGTIDPQTWERFHWDKRFRWWDGPYLIRASPWRRMETMKQVEAACRAALAKIVDGALEKERK